MIVFMPPPPLGGAHGGIMFLCHPFVCPSVHESVRPSVRDIVSTWYALMDFHQTFVSSVSWDKDELLRFLS